ncbi:MAG: hypothetical protein QM783_01450 [Phycisphaerales bacterium]
MGRHQIDDAVAGKIVVVTGASSWFGKGVALDLASQGAGLVLFLLQGLGELPSVDVPPPLPPPPSPRIAGPVERRQRR